MFWRKKKKPEKEPEKEIGLEDVLEELGGQVDEATYIHSEIVWDGAKQLPGVKRFLLLDEDEFSRCFVRLFGVIGKVAAYQHGKSDSPAGWLLFHVVLSKNRPFNRQAIRALCEWLAGRPNLNSWSEPVKPAVRAVHRFWKKTGLPESGPEMELLDRVFRQVEKDRNQSELKPARAHLYEMLGKKSGLPLIPGDLFGDQLAKTVKEMPDDEQTRWIWLLNHCSGATSAKPTKKWVKKAEELLEEVGGDSFVEVAKKVFADFKLPNAKAREQGWGEPSVYFLHDHNMDIVRGMIWAVPLVGRDELIRSLGRLAVSAYKKLPGVGPRAVRVGNACIYGLSQVSGEVSLGELAILKVRVKFRTAQNMIAKAFVAKAEVMGIAPAEIEEMAVPAYGLTEVGHAEIPFGEGFAALVDVLPGDKAVMTWKNHKNEKVQKSVPAAVKEASADDLKELKAMVKDIAKMLPAQRQRIEQLYYAKKVWSFDVWRERYLDHPLVGSLARRLIWNLGGADGGGPVIWTEEGFIGVDGVERADPGEGAEVSLWHPLESGEKDVLAWRDLLVERQIQQPFKQAHREIYVLTPAEENTATYSNRYAAHILKQHQFNALCLARSWKNQLRLMVDDEYPPASMSLPDYGIRADFWVEGMGDDYNDQTVNDSGTYLYLATDQVRFYRITAPERTAHAGGGGYASIRTDAHGDALPLNEIPEIVFSEVMRDVDLFVGVASVGNDAGWLDHGPDEDHRNYWQNFSFGELSGSAESRKELLQGLVPKLKIAKQCSFDDKFLIVEGALNSYKIHLGSGNILIAPMNRYLCIVQSQSVADKASDKIFLPFEGDRKLSVILSKAFLLASDDKIKDRTILAQLKRQ